MNAVSRTYRPGREQERAFPVGRTSLRLNQLSSSAHDDAARIDASTGVLSGLHSCGRSGGPRTACRENMPLYDRHSSALRRAARSCLYFFLLLMVFPGGAWAEESAGEADASVLSSPENQDACLPPLQTLDMDLSKQSIDFQPLGKGEYFVAETVGVAVFSLLEWELFCVASAPKNAEGDTADAVFTMSPAKNPENLGTNYHGFPIPLNAPVLVARSGPGRGMFEANRLSFMCHADELTPAGDYEGEIRFFWKIGRWEIPGRKLRCRLFCPAFVDVDVSPQQITYDVAMPGEYYNPEPIEVTVRTNMLRVPVVISLGDLLGERAGDLVSRNRFALGLGWTEKEASKKARSNPLGTTELEHVCHFGITRGYVSGRLETDMSVPAGVYQGQLVVTASGGL